MRFSGWGMFVFLLLTSQLHANPYKLTNFSSEKGSVSQVYHLSGKISTEIFRTSDPSYMASGYARAWSKKGVLIYDKKISRSGLVSSVNFKYYEDGAVHAAEYSSHPDGGIQWYRQTMVFDRDGQVTDTTEESNDDRVTVPVFLKKEIKEDPVYTVPPNSFYTEFNQWDPSGKTNKVRSAYPQEGKRETVYLVGKKMVKKEIEFNRKDGLLSVMLVYHSNGLVAVETLIQDRVSHRIHYDRKGRVIRREYNMPK